MRLSRISVAVMAFSGWAFSSQANAIEEPDVFSLSLKALLDVPLESSTLTQQTIDQVPAAITVYTDKQIQRLGVDYLHELMNLVTGFQSFRQEESGDEYYHSIRGHRTSTASREVLILLDGHRLNREADNAMAVPMLPLDNVKKIEFLRGPSSAIYGSNAFLGVVSITTHRDKTRTKVAMGEKSQQRVHLSYHDRFDTTEAYLNIGAKKDGGHHQVVQKQFTQEMVASSDPAQGLDVSAGFSNEHVRVELLHFERQSEKFLALGEVSDEWNETQNDFSSLKLSTDLYLHADLASELNLRGYQELYQTSADAFGFGITSIDQKSRGGEVSWRNDWFISPEQSLQFGLEFRYVDSDSLNINTRNFGSDVVYGSNIRKISGLYGQHQWRLFENTSLISGVRADHYSGFSESFSPRFGLIHQLSEHQTVKLLYGEAFRAPTFNETSLEQIFGLGNLVGNADLSPEKINTIEAVWMGNWDRSALSLTLFENQIEKSILRDASQTPNSFINSDNSDSSQGLEFEAQVELSDNLSFRGAHSVYHNLSQSDLRQASRLTSLEVNYQGQRWNLNLSAHYAGERSMLAGDQVLNLPAYWLASSKLQYQANTAINVYVQAKNLFDRRYLTPAERTTYTRGVSNREREFSAGLSWSFD